MQASLIVSLNDINCISSIQVVFTEVHYYSTY